jgi:hypothetical protein
MGIRTLDSSSRKSIRRRFLVIAGLLAFFLSFLGMVALLSLGAAWNMWNPKHLYSATRPLFAEGSYISDRLLGWRLIPNFRVFDSTGTRLLLHTDQYGFRNSESRGAARYKAILLGDSFVQGYYLSDPETIGNQLALKLGGRVLNLGVGGYSTDQEFIVGRAALDRFETDWIVLFFFSNDLPYLDKTVAWGLRKPKFVIKDGKVDFGTLLPVRSGNLKTEVFPPAPSFPIRIENMRTFCDYGPDRWRLFKHLLGRQVHALWDVVSFKKAEGNGLQLPDSAYLAPGSLSYEWDLAFQFIVELKRVAFAHNARLLVFDIPEFGQIQKKEYFAPQTEFLKRCQHAGIHCLEPHQTYLERTKKEPLYFTDDGHFSPSGASLAADLVYRYLAQNIIPER